MKMREWGTQVQQEGEVGSVVAGILVRTGKVQMPALINGRQQALTGYFEHN